MPSEWVHKLVKFFKGSMISIPFWHDFHRLFPTLVFQEAKFYVAGKDQFQIKLLKSKDSIIMNKNATLKDVSNIILSKNAAYAPIKVRNPLMQFYSEDRVELDHHTPVEVFTDGMFYIVSSAKNVVVTGGQQVKSNPLIPYSLKDLQFPVTIRHDIQEMIKRINLLCELKHGKPLLEIESLTKPQMEYLIVESLAEHKNWYGMGRQTELYNSWKRIYEKVQDMQQRKEKAEQIMVEEARKVMIWGVPLILANMAFIFFGTFYFLSWDIVQPIAYFLSSGTAIFLAGFYFLKYRRPFSYESALRFLAGKFRQKAYRRVDFNEKLYDEKIAELKTMEWKMKDYFYIRL